MNSDLLKNNYVFLPKFITPFRAKKLASEFKQHCLINNVEGDMQAQASSSVANYLPFIRLLVEKVHYLSDIVQDPLLPTYTYARVYNKGADLKVHTDRPACEVSITLNLDKDKDWPIYIKTPTGEERKIEMQPGDGMVYLGCIAPHWRYEYDGEEYVQVFMHYVRSFGKNAWAYFDNRKQDIFDNFNDEIPLTIA